MRKSGYKRGKYNTSHHTPKKLYNRAILKEISKDLNNKIIIAIVGAKFNFSHDNHYKFLLELLIYHNNGLFHILLKVNYYFSPHYSSNKQTKENYIFRYGKTEGLRRYFEKNKNAGDTIRKEYSDGVRKKTNYFAGNSVTYYISIGKSQEEAEQIVLDNKKRQKEASTKAIKENPDSSPLRIGYYLNKGMSEEEANEALIKRQTTFSLEKCIEKHGEEEGAKVWRARQDKWQATMKDKPSEEIERINKLKVKGAVDSVAGGHSKKEEDLLKKIEDIYSIHIERGVVLSSNNFIRTFDGAYKNVLIEFQGTYWHCDPRVYQEDFYHTIKKKTAKDIWEYDEHKRMLFENDGYIIFYIWEKDYDDKNILAQLLLEFGKYV